MLAVAAAASESRRTTVEALGSASAQLLMRQAAVTSEASAHVAEYVRRMHLWQRYEQLRGLDSAALAGRSVQAQDLWLADPRVPSASGAITDRVTDEPAQLAVALRLVRANNHTLTDRGRALRIAAPSQVAALRQEDDAANPMLVSSGAGLILVSALLEADYDFLRATYSVAVADRRAFTRSDVSGRMGDVCRHLRAEHRTLVRTGEDRKKLVRLKELADSIDSAGDAKTWGGARPPDQTSTLRLEPFVDLGLLTRTSRFDYSYTLSKYQAAFFDAIAEEPAHEKWAAADMIGRYCLARAADLPAVDPRDHWECIAAAWVDLRSPMGYASIDECLLLANARLIDGQIGHFELATGRDALRAVHKSDPRSIRFTMARGGAVSYFRLTETGPAA